MFYRVSWSATNSVSGPRPPDVTSFSATPGDGTVGLTWSNPSATNFSGVRVIRNTVWYPNDQFDGFTIFSGIGNSALDSGLVNGTRYYYKALAFDPVGVYSIGATASAVPTDTTPPPNVFGFAIVAGDHQVILNWQNPISADFAGVKIMRNAGAPPTGPSSGTMAYAGLGTSFTDTGLVNNTYYYYKAYSFDNALNYSVGVPSAAQPLNLLPPNSVTNVIAITGDSLITLLWSNPVGNDFVGVRIQRKIGTPPTNWSDGFTMYQGAAQAFTNTGLTNGVVYIYGLFSYDEVPNYASGVTVSAVPADTNAPGEVTSFAASAVPGGISLTWRNPNNSDLSGVLIKKKPTGYPSNISDGTTVYNGTGTNTVDSPLTDGWTTNYYRAFAYDEVPNYSAGANAFYAPLPNVTGFSAVPRDGAVVLRWTNPANTNLAGVIIQQSANAMPTNAVAGSTVYVGTGTSFTNASLTNTVTYYYAAYAFDVTPNYSSGVFTNAIPVDTNAPGNVTNLVAVGSNGTVSLSWVNPADADLAGVRVQRKISASPTNYADGVTVYDGLGAACTDTGLTNGTNYCYRVFAYDEVPNFSPGVSITSTPFRVLLTETFEDAGGWTDHTNVLWTQTAATGLWGTTDKGCYAITDASLAHSGTRWLRSADGLARAYLTMPACDNPCEVRLWARGGGILRLEYNVGTNWYAFQYDSHPISGNQYTNVIFRPLMKGHSGQLLRLCFDYGAAIYIDDVEIRGTP